MEAQEINGPPSLSGSEMLKVLSHHRKVCSAITRRDLLQVGGLGAIGLSLDSLLIQQASAEAIVTSTAPGFGQAKNCILLFLYGSPSQLETFDMKPDAPIEIRGPMQPIASSLPGMDVCELLPETAKVMDKTTIIRSMTHPYPIHGVAYATTGVPAIDVAMELAPNDLRHHPYFGSAVEYFDRQKRSAVESFPQNVALPFHMSSERTGKSIAPGLMPPSWGQPTIPSGRNTSAKRPARSRRHSAMKYWIAGILMLPVTRKVISVCRPPIDQTISVLIG